MKTPFDGILIAVAFDSAFEPVANVCTVEEAKAIALSDMKARNPNEDMCPEEYQIWTRQPDGRYKMAQKLTIE